MKSSATNCLMVSSINHVWANLVVRVMAVALSVSLIAPINRSIAEDSDLSIPIVTRSQMSSLPEVLKQMESLDGEGFLNLTGGAGMEFFQSENGENKAFLTLNLNPEFKIWKLGLGLGAPVRIDLEQGNIRSEDWDEPEDYLKVVRYIRYGAKGDTLYGRVGTLPAVSLGHGTVVDRLGMEIDPDHIRRGLEVGLDFNYVGLEYFQANIGDDPILGGRAFVRPLRIIDAESYFTRLEVGVSYVTDVSAPSSLQLDATGKPALDLDGNLKANETAVEIFTIDIGFPVINGDLIKMDLYMDEVFIKNAGQGFHTGLKGHFALPFGVNQALQYQAEYRLLDSDYIPQYFDNLYDVQKFQFPDGDSKVTKLQHLRGLPSNGSKSSSAFFEAAWALKDIVSFGANWQDTFADDNDQSAHMGIFLRGAVSKYRVAAAYSKKNFGTLPEAFTVDDRSIMAVSFGYRLNDFVEAVLNRTTQFELDSATGQYESLNTYSFMLNFVRKF